MRHLIYKELKLGLHPTALIFLGLSSMVMIPDYPYMVAFIYTCLAVFFTFITGRENNDMFFTASLPVKRSDVVKARCVLIALMELAQTAAAVPFVFLRQAVFPAGMENKAGMEPNAALFGFVLILYALFNLIYIPMAFHTTRKFGLPLVIAGVFVAIYIVTVEMAVQLIPQLKTALDNTDPAWAGVQLIVLAVGAVLFLCTMIAVCRLSQKRFERVNL